MKHLQLLILTILPSVLFSQIAAVSIRDEDIYYEKIDSFQGVSKDKLYAVAKEWFSSLYKRQVPSFDIDDKEDGKLVLKSTSRYNLGFGKGDVMLRYSINITVRDGRSRIVIADYSGMYITGVGASQETREINMAKLVTGIQTNKLSNKEEIVVQGLDKRANSLMDDFQAFAKKKIADDKF